MGWASGLQAGMRLGEAIRQGQIERDLAEESKKYRVTEGAYGPELQQNIEQVRALQAQVPEEQRAQYEPAIAELTRRQGLTAPDYSVSSGGYDGGKNYASAQEAQAALAPIRTQGLANVYRQSGEAEKADALEARALQNRAAGLQINKLQREEDKTVAYETGLKEINNQKFEKPEERTTAILDLIEKTQGPAARMQLESQYTQNDLNKITLKAKQFEDGFKQAFTKGADATMKWLDEQDPGFTLQRVGNQIIQTNLDGSKRVFAQGNEQQIMEQFAGHASPSNFLTLSKNVYDRQATADYRSTMLKIYGDKTLAGRIKETETQLGRQLTEDEVLSMSGVTAKGKAGGVLSRAVEQKKNDDGTYTAFDKGTGRALYNTYNGEELPLGMGVEQYEGLKKQARENKVGLQIGENANGQLALKFIGADGKPYDTAEAARYAKPAKDAAGAGAEEPEPALKKPNSRMGTGERNPYVDETGRPLPNAPAGAPAVGPALVRQGAAAVEGAVGSRASATRFLQGKIDRKEPLSPAEKARAKQLGLTVQ